MKIRDTLKKIKDSFKNACICEDWDEPIPRTYTNPKCPVHGEQ